MIKKNMFLDKKHSKQLIFQRLLIIWSSLIIRKSQFFLYFLWEGKVMHFLGSKMYNTHWTHWYISRFTGNKWSKRTYLIFLKAFSNCECATLEKINKEASWTLLYVRKFGIVSPKSPMSSNQWARPCPLRALERRRTEHWRSMHRKSNGNPLLLHDFFFLSLYFFYEHAENLHTIFFFFYAPLVSLE